MSQSAVGTAAPHGLRIVQIIAGRSLIVALPLPPDMGALQQSSTPFAVAAAMPTRDRAFWRRFSYTPVLLKISTILRGLGLRQINNGPGRILFQYNNVSQLADAVAEVVKRLPTTLEELLDAATDYAYAPLQEEIAHLLGRFGDEIWGAGKERAWLLQASEGKIEYQKDLVFEHAADQAVLMYYLRLWILVKAFNSLRNKVQPRAKLLPQASTGGQMTWNSTGPTSKSSLLHQDIQTATRGDALAAAADLAPISSAHDTLPDASKEQTDLPISNNLHVRRTVRIPKPRKDVDINYTSDTAPEESSQMNPDSTDETTRHYKGKGRTWKKTEIYKDSAFDVGKSTSKLRTKASLDEPTPRPRGRPKGSKVVWTNRGERQSRRLGKKALLVPAQAAVPMQEMPKPKASRRPRRNYLSEEVVRNSSDESEEDKILTRTSTYEDVESVIGTKTRHLARQSSEQRHGTENIPSVTGLDLDPRHSLSVRDPPVRRTSVRQPPGSCKSCSRRHQKCDRTHPTCGRCADLGFSCEYTQGSVSATPPSVAATTSPLRKHVPLPIQPTTEHLNGEYDLLVESVTDSTMPHAKRNLLLDEYWDEKTWRCFYLTYNERRIMLATMRSLGLKVVPRHRFKFRFDIGYFVSLGKDINKIARKLCNHFSATQLIRYAADRNYLDDRIDTLFETHSAIWSIDADRTKLLAPGADENYPRDLFYEESEDQKLLWVHLHRWIFIIALKNCKQMHGSGASNMDKVLQLGIAEVPEDMLSMYQLENSYTLHAPEESSGSVSPTALGGSASTIKDNTITSPILADSMFAGLILEECELNLFEALGQFFAEERGQQNEQDDSGTLLAAEPDPATGKPSRRRRKRKDSGITEPEDQNVIRPLKQRRTDQHRTTSTRHDFSALFMSYLENYTDPEFDELAALKNLAHELSVLEDYASNFHTEKGIEFATAFFVASFPAWLLYRQDIVNVKRKYASIQSSEEVSHRHLAVLERSRLATQLRQAHEKFMDAGHAGLRPEQVICRAMTTLQNEHGHSQTAEDIRMGFQGMEHEVKTLGNQLMKDGAKWILGDFVSVASLNGLQPHK
ncbi:hypothetical protein BU25DRAFT_405586 [Macroventuria anomochaeta]|uniref:Uncharacterized protein n=1 Tax=Macroventuria anomochaeta TaxID=301207 RepID=A0ACB6SHR4_9PLEO|nr:uncharacterized protein BU25DRAFT_405586 [Macroventuria anomochaeta]KAF2633716.1 hypothetical protein BU25DRAFT_405586 [Macroventuria anomochaeta]